MTKETKKFFRESNYIYQMQHDIWDNMNDKLEKLSFCVSKAYYHSLTDEGEVKYLFPQDIFVVVKGSFGKIGTNCKISLTLEYFSSFHDDLSASEQAVLDQIEQIAKTYGLHELK